MSDDFGVWSPNGTKTMWYKSEVENTGKIKAKHLPKGQVEADLKAKRFLCIHTTIPTFKRVVVKSEMNIKEEDTWKPLSHVFVQYYFEDGVVKDIVVPPHGNSKKGTPFARTKESVKDKIRSASTPGSEGRTKSKTIFTKLVEEKGGLLHVNSPSDIPRNRQQISNAHRCNTKQDDELVTLLLKCNEQAKSDDAFLREVGAAPETLAFFANNWQLNDIKRFCTDEENCSILGTDMTFNVGAYFVTVTVYWHTLLKTGSGVEPAMIGPVLCHQGKDYSSYYPLPSLMVKYCPELKSLQARHRLREGFD